MTISETETPDTCALLGLELDLTIGDPVLFDLGLAGWTTPPGWSREPLEQPAPGFRLLDEWATAMVEGVLDLRPNGTVTMALTEEGLRVARERWARLALWRRWRINRRGGPGLPPA
ncbi:hypothetical protein [Kitasatospora sp. NPDC058046]|uniref:hypothetical protein n=1 Tax=Kitasatospora sp. NPDC058046 TaxID=3346312 RepID=UPI0036DE693E